MGVKIKVDLNSELRRMSSVITVERKGTIKGSVDILRRTKKPKEKALSRQKFRIVLQVLWIRVKFYIARQQQLLKAEEDSLMSDL